MDRLVPVMTILIPIFGGLLVPAFKDRKLKGMHIYVESIVIITSAFVLFLLCNRNEDLIELIHFTGNLELAFKVDGLGTVFAGMVAILWPFATLYSFEYMKHEEREHSFFMFYTMTYGITLGIALSANILTMYCFYEMLTLVTLPLVMHTATREAVLASRKYLVYSMGGAAFAFIGMLFLIIYGHGGDFVYGGTLDLGLVGDRVNILLLVYMMAFMGFSVKAAMFPFHGWLPDASVAPTPVTALLHAVAVVKSGAFATMRLTYYCFGIDFLKGTWAQKVIMVLIIFTIVFGCSMAVKETHFKRRLAFSTISNLSYILFGVALMSPLGLVGALCHMVSHAFMKILSFLCAGSVIVQSGSTYVHQLDGMGKKMPKVFALFTISSFALMGVPGLSGFMSKWNLVRAAVAENTAWGYVGVVALLVSALLTGIYMMTVVVRAFIPGKDFDYSNIEKVTDPSWVMLVPLTFFAIGCIVIGLYSGPLLKFFNMIAGGMR